MTRDHTRDGGRGRRPPAGQTATGQVATGQTATDQTAAGQTGVERAGSGEALASLCEQLIREFIADPSRNNLGPGADVPAWQDFLLGFAAGDDPMWDELRRTGAPQHWTPAEAFAAARGAPDGASPRNSKQPATDWAAFPAAEAPGTRGPSPVPEDRDLTVVSWAVCQTEATKAANRAQTRVPAESWARARVFGQEANRGLHLTLLEALRSRGYEAVAPALLPGWMEIEPGTNRWRSTWSERHVAYVSGLGTFGLSGGLITRKGKAVRFGSVIVRAVIPTTPRPYDNPFAYCLHFNGRDCAECAERCPTSSVSVEGRDKPACLRQLEFAEEYVRRVYGFAGYGCGLCQTDVPCESGIPEGLRPDAD